jgi:NO-binding membrane sensor protein with MHYT domain
MTPSDLPLAGPYNYGPVALSVLIAVLASYTALDFAWISAYMVPRDTRLHCVHTAPFEMLVAGPKN